MIASKEQKFGQLVETIAPGAKLQRIWPLSGGTSAEMVAFEFKDVGGQIRKMVWRSYDKGIFEAISSSVAREFRLLQIIHSLGLATPTPHHLDLSGEIFNRPYLVLAYSEGQMLFTPPDLESYLHQFAAHLAQIHRADYTSFDLSFLPERANGCAEMRRKQAKSIDSSLYEERIRNGLTSLWPLSQQNNNTLLHGDYWPGNSLWQGGQLVAIIDWEDGEWGDPLIDLAKSRSEIVWIFGGEAMNRFTRYYQALMPFDYNHLPYWDLCAALRFIRLFGDNLAEVGAYFASLGRYDITEAAIRESFYYFVDQAFDKIGNF